MTEEALFDILREFLWAGVRMGAPLMIAAMIVGVAVGLLQALTSIQEMTLTFAPKLVVMLVVFWASLGYMTRLLVDLFNTRVIAFIAGG
ncbi:MAG: flagellar biosynthetic protein FliQ [Parvularculaceae bacterium]